MSWLGLTKPVPRGCSTPANPDSHRDPLALGPCSFRLALFDGGVDEVAPLRPATVVVANFVESKQVLEDKPRMGAALADSAVSYGFAVRPYAFTLVELDELVVGLEGAVVVGGFC